jgi:hypothetical protein
MPSWNDLVNEVSALPPDKKGPWFQSRQTNALQAIAARRGGRNVILYSSGFLQKPQAPPQILQITFEDINAFMSVMYGMKWDKGLTLVLHTPGGQTNAAESIVAYLRSKFEYIEVIVPAYAMSAGTMISLAADRIVMGRQSQLGPIDPQFMMGNTALSAQAVVDQFEQAKQDILSNTVLAHLWAPVLQTIGPALLQEARNALDYGEGMVKRWLAQWMFRDKPKTDADELATRAAAHFNDAAKHKSHGRRIDREEARAQSLVVEDLEADQALQEAVLTAYHLQTIIIEQTPATKLLMSDAGRGFVKNWAPEGLRLAAPPRP